MNISSSKLTTKMPCQSCTGAQKTEQPTNSVSTEPQDSVTFGGDTGSKIGASISYGAFGVIPVVGAATNALSGFSTFDGGSEAAIPVGLAGAGLNLTGSAVLAGGYLFGNDTAKQIGKGLLGLSGIAGIAAGWASESRD